MNRPKVIPGPFDGLKLVSPIRFPDPRGSFTELYHAGKYRKAGLDAEFVQDNQTRSCRNVLRGLHFQNPYGQGKLIFVTEGEIFDAVVDLRRDSPTFGRWASFVLSAENGLQLYVPPGFAHGMLITSEHACVHYKCTEFYHFETEHTLMWNDSDVGIEWPCDEPLLSEKDTTGKRLAEFADSDLFRLG